MRLECSTESWQVNQLKCAFARQTRDHLQEVSEEIGQKTSDNESGHGCARDLRGARKAARYTPENGISLEFIIFSCCRCSNAIEETS